MLIAGSSIKEIENLKKEVIKTVRNEGFGKCKTNPWDENY